MMLMEFIDVNFKISSCESAFDDIIKSIQNPTILYNIDIGSCGYINNNCYYEGINAIWDNVKVLKIIVLVYNIVVFMKMFAKLMIVKDLIMKQIVQL